ncbi:hypothetical protein GCM10022267_66920 [Lentzea roselyniae]|uniref:HTH iclR-type domain-containing protein n=1 Tax=Lentzea roselyniae TaxID=531940 RepID=A0ABP7BV85_9PSEU
MRNNGEERDAALVQSVDRAVAILELLARNGEAGITEIAAELGCGRRRATSPSGWGTPCPDSPRRPASPRPEPGARSRSGIVTTRNVVVSDAAVRATGA